MRGQDFGFQVSYVGADCVVEPVEVVLPDSVEVDQRYVFKAGAHDRLGDETAHASVPDDADPKAHKIRLALCTPRRYRPHLGFCGTWRGCQPVVVVHDKPVPHHPHRTAGRTWISPRRRSLPEPRAPRAVTGKRESDEGQTCRTKYGACVALLGGNVIRTHALPPSAERMAVKESESGASGSSLS